MWEVSFISSTYCEGKAVCAEFRQRICMQVQYWYQRQGGGALGQISASIAVYARCLIAIFGFFGMNVAVIGVTLMEHRRSNAAWSCRLDSSDNFEGFSRAQTHAIPAR